MHGHVQVRTVPHPSTHVHFLKMGTVPPNATSTGLTKSTLHASTICTVFQVADALRHTSKLTEHTKSTVLLPCTLLSICRGSVARVAFEHILPPKQGKGHAAANATWYMSGYGHGLHDRQRGRRVTHCHAVLSTLPTFMPPTPPHVQHPLQC